MSAIAKVRHWRNGFARAILAGMLYPSGAMAGTSAHPIMGLAYQPYVGHWSQGTDNPYAPGSRYVPSFNTYAGGIDLDAPERSLLDARQTVDLTFDSAGKVTKIQAHGSLKANPNALNGGSDTQWSRTYFRFFKGREAQPATQIDHQASVFRQLTHLVRRAKGAPLTLTSYGAGYQAGYWRDLAGQGYATLPVWTDSRVNFISAAGERLDRNRAIDQIHFYFPPTAAYVRMAPERVRVETTGIPGRDLAVKAIHLTLFEPASKASAGATLNPGFFAGDASGQVALAAAEINARAGKRLLTIKQGVENAAAYGTLANDRMRFAILSALAQAQAANRRFPGTVTHLVISNEYAIPALKAGNALTPTEQVTEMVRFARSQLAPGGDFEGVGLKVGVRGASFRALDTRTTDPVIRQFNRDVAALLRATDFLMENVYPSPEAVEAASRSGHWDAFFHPASGELSIQWGRLRQAVSDISSGRSIDLMIGEIGHPSNGIGFNLPGYPIDGSAPDAHSAFARIGQTISDGARIGTRGIKIFQGYFNPRIAQSFLSAAVVWSRQTGVQIHAFEAFDEPYKSGQNLTLPGQTQASSLLSSQGGYGAEGFYGLFGYSGVANFQAGPARPSPGSRLSAQLPAGSHWADQFSGSFYDKYPDFDFAAAAASFEADTSP